MKKIQKCLKNNIKIFFYPKKGLKTRKKYSKNFSRINKGLKVSEPEKNKFLQQEEIEIINEAKKATSKEKENKAVEISEDLILVNSSKENYAEELESKYKEEIFERPESKFKLKPKSKPKASLPPIVFNAVNLNVRKRTFLEEWMLNSLAPNAEEERTILKNKGEKEFLEKDDEMNETDFKLNFNDDIHTKKFINDNIEDQQQIDIQAKDLINENIENQQEIDIQNQQQIESKGSKESGETSNNEILQNTNNQYAFSIDRFNENKCLRDLLKKRKQEKKEELSSKVKEIFRKNNVDMNIFSDQSLLNLLQKNIKKIPKSANK